MCSEEPSISPGLRSSGVVSRLNLKRTKSDLRKKPEEEERLWYTRPRPLFLVAGEPREELRAIHLPLEVEPVKVREKSHVAT